MATFGESSGCSRWEFPGLTSLARVLVLLSVRTLATLALEFPDLLMLFTRLDEGRIGFGSFSHVSDGTVRLLEGERHQSSGRNTQISSLDFCIYGQVPTKCLALVRELCSRLLKVSRAFVRVAIFVKRSKAI